jgi:predicted HTH domain antitoxin
MVIKIPVIVAPLKEGGYMERCEEIRATTTGDTPDDAIQNLREAIDEMIKEYGQNAVFQEKEMEDEFRKELALALYQRGVLSSGKARLLARMTRWQFEELLGKRLIERHYAEKDLQEDIAYGFGHQ